MFVRTGYSVSRISRYAALNNITLRAFTSAKITTILGPTGTCRNDGKRFDGICITAGPWKLGRELVRDAFCVDNGPYPFYCLRALLHQNRRESQKAQMS